MEPSLNSQHSIHRANRHNSIFSTKNSTALHYSKLFRLPGFHLLASIYIYIYIHRHTQTHRETQRHTRAHTDTQAHTRAHTRARTHTHTKLVSALLVSKYRPMDSEGFRSVVVMQFFRVTSNGTARTPY
jgi:hypothetical protein